MADSVAIGHCLDCKHWDASTEARSCNHDSAQEIGLCRANLPEMEMADRMVIPVDAEYGIETRSHFGCVQFESK